MHKHLSGFDFQNGLYYYNVGEGFHRNWDDYVQYGFISAGQAPRFRDVLVGNIPLLQKELVCPNIAENSNDLENSEYVALVDWVRAVPRSEAKWKPKSGLFTSQLVRASLDGQPQTVKYLEQEFDIDFAELLQ